MSGGSRDRRDPLVSCEVPALAAASSISGIPFVLGVVAVILLVVSPVRAGAQAVFISNGLAPPNPANVISASNSILADLGVSNGTTVAVVAGGFVDGDAVVLDTSRIDLLGGVVTGGIVTFSAAALVIDSGVVGGVVSAAGTSSIDVLGGSIQGGLQSTGGSSVTLAGGLVSGPLVASDSSVLVISSGGVDGITTASGSAMVSLTGGSITSDVVSLGEAEVRISGGSISGDLAAFGSSIITIEAFDLAVNGVPILPGPIEEENGIITGTLLSGDAVSNQFSHSGAFATGLITFVPEPASQIPVALLTLAALCCPWRRCYDQGAWYGITRSAARLTATDSPPPRGRAKFRNSGEHG